MRLIDADLLYTQLQKDEELARKRVLDTESFSPYPNNLNPSYTRYVAQMDERTRLKHMVADAPTIEPQQTCEYWDSESKFCALCRPSVQPQPRTGKWIHIRTEEDGNALYECSLCHMGEIHVPIVEVKYCWNCGAKMEAET